MGAQVWAGHCPQPAPAAASSNWHVVPGRNGGLHPGQTHGPVASLDSEGEILDILMQSRRDKAAALTLMRKLPTKQSVAPSELVTDKLPSYCTNPAFQPAMSRDFGETIAWRTRIRGCANASRRCTDSNPLDQLSASCVSTLRSTISSISSAISSPARRCASSEQRRQTIGIRRHSPPER